jgi:cyanophycinase
MAPRSLSPNGHAPIPGFHEGGILEPMAQTFFQATNTLALVAWIALVLFPARRAVSTVACAVVIPGLLALAYAVVIGCKLAANGPPPSDVGTIAGLRRVFEDDWVFAAAWTHYLAFDMVVGAWIARDAVRLALPWPLRTLALVLTFLAGPVGLLVHLLARLLLRRAVAADGHETPAAGSSAAGVLLAIALALGAGPELTAETPPRGSLVIIGGSERFRDRELWDTITELAGGDGARIAIFPTAGGKDPARSCARLVHAFEHAGAEPVVVPVAWGEADRDVHDAVADAELVRMVRRCTGVYFVGGAQGRIVDAMREEDGRDTPMLAAIREIYREGGVIAGTSAGAAIMGRVMYRDAPRPLQILRDGVRMGRELDAGLGFLDPEWFVEQHCLVRGRFARAVVAMRSQGIPYGIGVDENTALVVREGRHGTVIGYKGVLILDASAASSDPEEEQFNVENVRLSYLDRGDGIDLHTLEVTPAPEKRDEIVLDPNADDFDPYYSHRMFYTDILGNATVADLLGRLIDNEEDEAVGLAFSGLDAREQASEGFEFRFYRGPDSKGWYTEGFGGEDYTVLGIHLDIRPISITGPLYTRRPTRDLPRATDENSGEIEMEDAAPNRDVSPAGESE